MTTNNTAGTYKPYSYAASRTDKPIPAPSSGMWAKQYNPPLNSFLSYLTKHEPAYVGSGSFRGASITLSGDCYLSGAVCGSTPSRAPMYRAAIRGFSRSSRVRMRRFLSSVAANYIALGTLTYPESFPADGAIVKRHLRAFLQWCRRRMAALPSHEKHGVFWFLEFQERGAPHFHFFSTFTIPHQALAEAWFRIVGSCDERHLEAGTSIEAIRYTNDRSVTCGYALKYAQKASQKDVPEGYANVGRFWGAIGCVSCHRERVRFPATKQGHVAYLMCCRELCLVIGDYVRPPITVDGALLNHVLFVDKESARRNMRIDMVPVFACVIPFKHDLSASVLTTMEYWHNLAIHASPEAFQAMCALHDGRFFRSQEYAAVPFDERVTAQEAMRKDSPRAML